MRAPAKALVLLLSLCGFHAAVGIAWGEKDVGLSVQPGWLSILNVPVGQLYDVEDRTRMRFKIHNGSDKARRYRVKADEPGKLGVKVLKGYAGIPDPAWFWFETNEVSAPANGAVEIGMFLRIPEGERYCNQKWAVGIDVESRPEAGEALVLAVSPVFYIETESRAGVKEKPAGLLGVAPATIVLTNSAPDQGKPVSTLRVYNNDNRPHLYKITSTIPSAGPGRQVIAPSPGAPWIPDAEWLKPSPSALSIGPNGQEAVALTLDIPGQQEFHNRRWQGVVLIESEDGLASFVRVQIQTSAR